MLRRFGLLAVVLLISSSEGAETNKPAVIVGAGTNSCRQFLEFRQSDRQTSTYIYGSWIQGYLSGINTQRRTGTPPAQMESLPSIDALLAKMEKYCGDNLLSEFWLGGVQLFADLQKK